MADRRSLEIGERVRVRSRCRVDLAGGTLDIWPLGLLHPDSRTINIAVDLPVEVEVRRREHGYRVVQDGKAVEERTVEALEERSETALVAAAVRLLALPPAELRLRSGSPRGGGLGASSALIVALLVAGEELLGRVRSSPRRLAALGRDLEARMMALPTGVQDHYPGLLGGVLEIRHRPGGEEVEHLPVDLEQIGRSLVVAYTGRSHFSAGQNWQVVRRRLDGDPRTVDLFEGIAETARAAAAALRSGDLAGAGEQLAREWSYRRGLAEGVSTPEIEALLERARQAGAWGGKACGAGGGGSIAVLCPPERRAAVEGALAAGEARLLETAPTASVLEVDRGHD